VRRLGCVYKNNHHIKNMDYQSARAISELQVSLTRKYIMKPIDGDINVDRYFDFSNLIDRGALLVAKTFNTFDEFKAYLEENYPWTVEEDINHEEEHMQIARRHGLKKITFAVLETEGGLVKYFK
jgi:2-hydroxychromene-2-carboxylate isomerase